MYLTRAAGIETGKDGFRDVQYSLMYLTRAAGIETRDVKTILQKIVGCILPAPRELKRITSFLKISFLRCILPAPRELKPILNICLLFIFGRCILPALRELKHDIYRTFIILCHDVSYPHCGNVAAVALQGCAQPQNLTAVCRGGACPARNLP